MKPAVTGGKEKRKTDESNEMDFYFNILFGSWGF
jgi:hypothetical protein